MCKQNQAFSGASVRAGKHAPDNMAARVIRSTSLLHHHVINHFYTISVSLTVAVTIQAEGRNLLLQL